MNIGILGTGSIARTMAAEFAKVPAFRCEAVCSRQQTTGEALAQQFSIPKVYTDYDAMLADPDIELVYIATPNSLHYAQTKAALLAGKNVLCEKPFVPTVAEADELIALAKEKHLFLFEAITTAHHPNYALAKQYLDDIGSLRIVSCTFCQYSSRYDALLSGQVPPVFDPACCGGALMDLNLYNVHFVVGLFGEPMLVSYHPNLYRNGIDTSGTSCWNTPTSSASVPAQRTAPRRAASSSSATRAASSSSRAAATARSSASSVPDRKIFAASTASRRGSTRWRRSP